MAHLDAQFGTPTHGAAYARKMREFTVPAASCNSHYQAGFAIGRAMHTTIARAVNDSQLIAKLAQWTETAEGSAVLADFQKLHEHTYPRLMDEVRGLAAGSGVDFRRTLLNNMARNSANRPKHKFHQARNERAKLSRVAPTCTVSLQSRAGLGSQPRSGLITKTLVLAATSCTAAQSEARQATPRSPPLVASRAGLGVATAVVWRNQSTRSRRCHSEGKARDVLSAVGLGARTVSRLVH
eukprot:SAG11_NODE_1747_length_4330_cov_2.029307_4_plen_239_part_00